MIAEASRNIYMTEPVTMQLDQGTAHSHRQDGQRYALHAEAVDAYTDLLDLRPLQGDVVLKEDRQDNFLIGGDKRGRNAFEVIIDSPPEDVADPLFVTKAIVAALFQSPEYNPRVKADLRNDRGARIASAAVAAIVGISLAQSEISNVEAAGVLTIGTGLALAAGWIAHIEAYPFPLLSRLTGNHKLPEAAMGHISETAVSLVSRGVPNSYARWWSVKGE